MHASQHAHENFAGYRHGIRDNLAQFLHQLVQVFLVGLTLGMMRTVVP
ncbi:MAG: MFS transporter, partial [Pseudomonadota bacterium]